MAAFYAKYPASVSTNPSIGTNGATAPTSSTEVGGIGPDGNLHPISTDNSGNQNVNVISSALPAGAATAANQATQINQMTTALSRLTGSLVPTAYDEVALTYVASGNGAGQIATAVYKLATVTVKTLTLSYNASNQLIDVVAS